MGSRRPRTRRPDPARGRAWTLRLSDPGAPCPPPAPTLGRRAEAPTHPCRFRFAATVRAALTQHPALHTHNAPERASARELSPSVGIDLHSEACVRAHAAPCTPCAPPAPRLGRRAEAPTHPCRFRFAAAARAALIQHPDLHTHNAPEHASARELSHSVGIDLHSEARVRARARSPLHAHAHAMTAAKTRPARLHPAGTALLARPALIPAEDAPNDTWGKMSGASTRPARAPPTCAPTRPHSPQHAVQSSPPKAPTLSPPAPAPPNHRPSAPIHPHPPRHPRLARRGPPPLPFAAFSNSPRPPAAARAPCCLGARRSRAAPTHNSSICDACRQTYSAAPCLCRFPQQDMPRPTSLPLCRPAPRRPAALPLHCHCCCLARPPLPGARRGGAAHPQEPGRPQHSGPPTPRLLANSRSDGGRRPRL
ncbi:MAG: hypothetical protein J3K34DRAFT_231982 [Monoraphidium minutum]|nr:MAG: hypothetical protein J3K34DRAFT_231982 [Monoraphidium minutum]